MGLRGGVVLGALAALTACGAGGGSVEDVTGDTPPSVTEPSPATGQPTEAMPPPVVGRPSEPAPPPVVTPRPTPPTPPETGPATRRHATACSRWEYRQDGSLQRRLTLGGDGLPRENVYFFADGVEASREVRQVEAGRVSVLERFYRGQLESRVAWTYGERGEVLRQEGADHRYNPARATSTTFLYDAQGRLEREDRADATGALYARRLYTYGALGLERIVLKEAEGAYVYSSTTYTYHPNGKVAREDEQGESSHVWREFDTEGREVRSGKAFDESSGRTEQHYDAAGRLARRLHTSSGSSGTSLREETFTYDAVGRLTAQHVVWDWRNNWTGEDHRVREAHRYEYDARGDLALQTCDTNEDGAPDWRRTFTRDAFGNLLEEQLTGPASPLELGRVVHTYECHE